MADHAARLQSLQNRIRVNGITGLKRVMTLGSWLNLYFFWEKKWFFIAIIVGALMLQMPVPGGLSREGWIVLTMLVVAVILFITEPVPLPTVALLIIVGQVLLSPCYLGNVLTARQHSQGSHAFDGHLTRLHQ